MADIDDFFGDVPRQVVQAVQGLEASAIAKLLAVVGPAAVVKTKAEDQGNIVDAISAVSPELGKLAGSFKQNKVKTAAIIGLLVFALNKCSLDLKVELNINDLFHEMNKQKPVASQGMDDPQKKEAERHGQPPSGSAGEEQGNSKLGRDGSRNIHKTFLLNSAAYIGRIYGEG